MQEALKTSKEFILKGVKLMVRKADPTKSRKKTEWRGTNMVQGQQRTYAQVVTGEDIECQKKGAPLASTNKVEQQRKEGERQNVRTCELIERSILGDMREFDTQKKISAELAEAGVENKMSYLGGMKILITFRDIETRQKFQRQNIRKLNGWFREWRSNPTSFTCRERLAWMEIRSVPLKHWNNSLFRTIGNIIGRFIGMSRDSAMMERMDRGRIVVEVKEGSNIPNSMLVKDGTEEFRVKIGFWKWVEDLTSADIINEITSVASETGMTAGEVKHHVTLWSINEGGRLEENGVVNETMVTEQTDRSRQNEFELMKGAEDDNSSQPRGDVIIDMELAQRELLPAEQRPVDQMGEIEESPTKEWVLETQEEPLRKNKGKAQISQFQNSKQLEGKENRTEEISAESSKTNSRRNEDTRMIVFNGSNESGNEETQSMKLTTVEETPIEDMIRREIRQMITEGTDLGITCRNQGEELERDFRRVLAGMDRRFRPSNIPRTRDESRYRYFS